MPEQNSDRRSAWLGFVFIFNIIVGTGALTLPAAFAKCGWLLGLFIIILLALISYITATFVVETIACANAVENWQNLHFQRGVDGENDEDEELLGNEYLIRDTNDNNETPLRYLYYKLDKKFELGDMASMFFNNCGRIMFYLCLVIYLYGDLSIYSAAVAKTLMDLACDAPNNTDISTSVKQNIYFLFFDNSIDGRRCWSHYTLTRQNVYRLFLIGFFIVLGPLVAFSVQKTKYLQILTIVFRWLAFVLMISLAIKLLIFDGGRGNPAVIKINGVPAIFGACIYSFMCHHSLPSFLEPIRNKHNLAFVLRADYFLICIFYILLAMTGIFAFKHLEDLYTLNFVPNLIDGHLALVVIDYFLALFPVFTLSASFPIISITLRNNLQTLFLDMSRFELYNVFIRRFIFPLCTLIPPFIITYFTQSLTNLVAFTGSYAGTGIQYLIPVALVYFARRTCRDLLGSGVINEFRSSFCNGGWLIFVLFWSLICMGFVTLNIFK